MDYHTYQKKVGNRIEPFLRDEDGYVSAVGQRVLAWIGNSKNMKDLVFIDRLMGYVMGQVPEKYRDNFGFGKYGERIEIRLKDVKAGGKKRRRHTDAGPGERKFYEDQVANCELCGAHLTNYAHKVSLRLIVTDERAAKKYGYHIRVKLGQTPGKGYAGQNATFQVGDEDLGKLTGFANDLGDKYLWECAQTSREIIAEHAKTLQKQISKYEPLAESERIPRTYISKMREMMRKGELREHPEVVRAFVKYTNPAQEGFDERDANTLLMFARANIKLKPSQVLGTLGDDIRYLAKQGKLYLTGEYKAGTSFGQQLSNAMTFDEAKAFRLAVHKQLGKPLGRARREHNLAMLKSWVGDLAEPTYYNRLVSEIRKCHNDNPKTDKALSRYLHILDKTAETNKIAAWLATLDFVPMEKTQKYLRGVSAVAESGGFADKLLLTDEDREIVKYVDEMYRHNIFDGLGKERSKPLVVRYPKICTNAGKTAVTNKSAYRKARVELNGIECAKGTEAETMLALADSSFWQKYIQDKFGYPTLAALNNMRKCGIENVYLGPKAIEEIRKISDKIMGDGGVPKPSETEG